MWHLTSTLPNQVKKIEVSIDKVLNQVVCGGHTPQRVLMGQSKMDSIILSKKVGKMLPIPKFRLVCL